MSRLDFAMNAAFQLLVLCPPVLLLVLLFCAPWKRWAAR